MAKWHVNIHYHCGFTKSPEWQEDARRVFEGQGWSNIKFWNSYSEGFCQTSGWMDADEVSFTAPDETIDKATVQDVLAQVGISTPYIDITRIEPEGQA